MHILSDLVRYYNQLCALTSVNAQRSANAELEKILQLTDNQELHTIRQTLLDNFNNFELVFDQLKQQVKEQISVAERPYIENSYRAYEENRGYRYEWLKSPHPSDSVEIQENNLRMHVENILGNHLPVTEKTPDIISNRILRHSSWKNTTMIIRPGNEPWLSQLVSNDPIYLVDENYDLLKPALMQFNEIYQNRLRTYVIREDHDDQEILWQLPDAQFGLVLAWNFFNHRPFEIVRKYLTEIYRKLKPGGYLLMTFNDCDRWPGVKAVESGVGLYTPGSLIDAFATHLGFESQFRYHDHGPWTWVEYSKPGVQESLRGGQALAKILPKPIA